MNDHKEMEKVLLVIKKYTDGTYTGDVSALKDAFHENAVMNGYLGTNLLMGSPQPFFDDIAGTASMKSNGDPYSAQIESVRIDGDVAIAVLSETGFRGDATLVNFFQLIKIDGEWKIVTKLFTTA